MKELMNYLQPISIIITCITATITCIVAICGINAWKRKFIGKRKIELAEEVIGAFFAVRDAIAYIRHPLSFSDEGSTRQKDDSESPEETKLLNRAYIVYERYNNKRDVFNHFAVLKYRFMASFGKHTENIFNSINNVINRIFTATEMLGIHYWRNLDQLKNIDRDERDKYCKEMHNAESIIYERYWDDPLKPALDRALQELEEVTAQCFGNKQTFIMRLFIQCGIWIRRLFRHDSNGG